MDILVCDDHPLVLDALELTVARLFPGARIAVAGDYATACARAEGLAELALCLVDLDMPAGDPPADLAQLKASIGRAKLVIVSGSEQDAEIAAALRVGVDGFLPKSARGELIEPALRLVMAGGEYLPPRLAVLAATASDAADALPYGRLSKRQRTVLAEVAAGRSNKQIALGLGLSPATVKTHVAHIIAVLGAANRTEAAAHARSRGLV